MLVRAVRDGLPLVELERLIADEVFGTRAAAHAWLHHPNGALGGRIPLALLDTVEGAALVEAVLGRIAHGIVE